MQLLHVKHAHGTNHRYTGKYVLVIHVRDIGNAHTKIVGVDMGTYLLQILDNRLAYSGEEHYYRRIFLSTTDFSLNPKEHNRSHQ